MDDVRLLALYRWMVTARQLDKAEHQLTSRGEAFFHVSGAGHESSVALAPHLIDDDWLHCHYRDKALMLARGLTAKNFLDALLCKEDSHSRGRQMSAHMSDPDRNVLSIVGPVGNSALQSVGIAASVKKQKTRPIVLCSVGDGTTQQGEFLEACAEAVRSHLPVLFFIEDNGLSISTTTANKTFYATPEQTLYEFYGVPIRRVNGRDVVTSEKQLGEIVGEMRRERGPQFVVFDVERLADHTNTDDQLIYRSADSIAVAEKTGDPIRRLEEELLKRGCPEQVLGEFRQEASRELDAAEAESIAGAEPVTIFSAKRQLPVELTHSSREQRGKTDGPRLNMREALRDVLDHHLQTDSRVTLLGEDIEDPKGDVFGVTKGLSAKYGNRVANSALSESTILGVSIGRALAGERPVAFLQFADFLPLAFNQIVSELGSLHWRSDGRWQAPVIVMIACGGYRPGLGPFHAQTFESLAVHTPGIDVFMPSTAGDGAGLLNAAFRSERPTLFFYPKSCLNDPQRTTASDVSQQFVPIGPARKARAGRDITFVSWGNTVRLCMEASDVLDTAGIEADVIDLRSLSPWDEHAVVTSAERTAHLVVVHEDNHTCGLGGEVIATVAERARVPVAMRRVTRADTYVPCNFANQVEVLPSLRRVLETCSELLDLDLSWETPVACEDGIDQIMAIGSGPSDEMVQVVEIKVQPGDVVCRGDVVASLEATKSVFDLTSSISGTVHRVLASPGDEVAVGGPLIDLKLEESVANPRKSSIAPGIPQLKRRAQNRFRVTPKEGEPRRFEVGVSGVTTVEGGRLVSNKELLAREMLSSSNAMTADDIVRRTGIEDRRWVNEGEDAVGMSVTASRQLLDQLNLIPDDLDLVICTTTSPTSVTPSMACRILNGLTGGNPDAMVQAYDINAACSGYLYALQSGYDFLQSAPQGRVLIVTAEVLSPLLDPDDFDTAIIFGDACSATVLYGEEHIDQAQARVLRPDLSARSDDDGALCVPLVDHGYIQMKGRKVFSEAVRSMLSSLNRVCTREGIGVGDLRLVIPHQANGRIIKALQNRINVEVFSNIRHHGNTSSTSIPLCLADVLERSDQGDRYGLCAFGGGFTFGASILEVT